MIASAVSRSVSSVASSLAPGHWPGRPSPSCCETPGQSHAALLRACPDVRSRFPGGGGPGPVYVPGEYRGREWHETTFPQGAGHESGRGAGGVPARTCRLCRGLADEMQTIGRRARGVAPPEVRESRVGMRGIGVARVGLAAQPFLQDGQCGGEVLAVTPHPVTNSMAPRHCFRCVGSGQRKNVAACPACWWDRSTSCRRSYKRASDRFNSGIEGAALARWVSLSSRWPASRASPPSMVCASRESGSPARTRRKWSCAVRLDNADCLTPDSGSLGLPQVSGDVAVRRRRPVRFSRVVPRLSLFRRDTSSSVTVRK